LRIREFKLDDYEALTKLWLEAGLGFRLGDDIDSVRVKVGRDPELFLVAEEGGKLVGSVLGAWDGRRGWIYHLGVLPNYRRSGVASMLVAELEERMKEKGVSKVNGLVYEWNSASLSFFKGAGYSIQSMMEVEKQLAEPKYPLVAPQGEGRKERPSRRPRPPVRREKPRAGRSH
jgi:ribosomal protein S18 acetylase RimI-like enzyme